MGNNFKTYIFMGVVTLISSLLLSYSYSSLKNLTKENIEFDIKRNIIKSVGYSITTMSKDDINANYDANIREMILDKNNKIMTESSKAASKIKEKAPIKKEKKEEKKK